MTTKEIINGINQKYGVSDRIEIPANVYASYIDGKGNYILTIDELEQKFKSESKGWREWFFNNLLTTGVAHSKFAEYTIVKYDDNGNQIK